MLCQYLVLLHSSGTCSSSSSCSDAMRVRVLAAFAAPPSLHDLLLNKTLLSLFSLTLPLPASSRVSVLAAGHPVSLSPLPPLTLSLSLFSRLSITPLLRERQTDGSVSQSLSVLSPALTSGYPILSPLSVSSLSRALSGQSINTSSSSSFPLLVLLLLLFLLLIRRAGHATPACADVTSTSFITFSLNKPSSSSSSSSSSLPPPPHLTLGTRDTRMPSST